MSTIPVPIGGDQNAEVSFLVEANEDVCDRPLLAEDPDRNLLVDAGVASRFGAQHDSLRVVSRVSGGELKWLAAPERVGSSGARFLLGFHSCGYDDFAA